MLRPDPILVFKNKKNKIVAVHLAWPCVPRIGDIVCNSYNDPYKVLQVIWYCNWSQAYEDRMHTEIQVIVEPK